MKSPGLKPPEFSAIFTGLKPGASTPKARPLLRTAQEFTGMSEKGALIREALRALIEREASRRLTALEGAMPDPEDIPRLRVSGL
jgi:hypothetical protein